MKGYICLDEDIHGFEGWEHYRAFEALLEQSNRFKPTDPIAGKFHPAVERRIKWFKKLEDGSIWALDVPDPPARGQWTCELE